jgi:hypothetical protein
MNLRGTVRLGLLALSLCALSPAATSAQRAAPGRVLSVFVDEKGGVSLEFAITLPQPPPPQGDARPEGCCGPLVVAVPLALSLGERNLGASNNMLISPLHAAKSYTLLAVVVPAGTRELNFRLDDVGGLSDTPDGRSKLELNFSYPDAPQFERDLLGAPTTVSTYDLRVSLPQEYGAGDVSLSPAALRRDGARSYVMEYAAAAAGGSPEVVLAFPSPTKRVTEQGKLILTLLGSLVLMLIEFRGFQEKGIKLPVAVLLASFVALGVTSYYWYALRKVAEFSTFLAGIVPQLLYGATASAYLLLAARFQAQVQAFVKLGGADFGPVEVYLMRVKGEQETFRVAADRATRDNGCTFYVWVWKSPKTYKVAVPANAYTAPGLSGAFSPARKERPIITVEVERKPVLAPAAPDAAAGMQQAPGHH